MKFLVATALLAAAGVSAKNNGVSAKNNTARVNDISLLQFALTLEHLENAFYAYGLKKWDAGDFEGAGYPDYVRKTLVQLGSHEASHVKLLTDVLEGNGQRPTKPCVYKFTDTSISQFLATSQLLESVGVSAYLGAMASIATPGFVTAAGSIAQVEARHQSELNIIQGTSGAPSSLDTPISPSMALTLASSFIVSCPKTNPVLPARKFSPLSIVGKTGPGRAVKVRSNSCSVTPRYLAVVSGLNIHYSNITKTGKNEWETKLPRVSGGKFYLALTINQSIADASVVAGPAVGTVPVPGPPPALENQSTKLRRRYR